MMNGMVGYSASTRLAVMIGQCRVFLMVGYPGSGKSTLARKMAAAWSAHYLSSDELRQQLFKSTRYDRVGDAVIAQQREQLYPLLAAAILDQLKTHSQVILDATNLETAKRELIVSLLMTSLQARQICFVCVKTPKQVIQSRLRALSQGQDDSLLADWTRVYQIFQIKRRQGLISWPRATVAGIPVVTAQRIYALLDE